MASDALKIRPAGEADVHLLIEFIRCIAAYEKLLDEVVATEEGVRQSLFGEKSAAEALIGEWDGEPVAFAVYFENFSTFMGRSGLYLEDLFVKLEYRKRGIGKLMLKHLAKIAMERGCSRFEWVALNWNEPAIGFYKGLGAKQMSDWRLFRMSGEALKQLAAEGSARGLSSSLRASGEMRRVESNETDCPFHVFPAICPYHSSGSATR
jgi:GNAT superfamily N-acetyltransferase|tara:strand:- start:963 stop:1586 length:624 start_codon:yes stop_codon:yes gene_type:complete